MTSIADVDFREQPGLGRVIGKCSEQFGREVKLIGDHWESPCPCHPSTGRELAMSGDEQGRAVLACNRKCDPEEIVRAAGFDRADVALPPAPLRFRLLTVQDLGEIPAPVPLVEGVLSRDTLVTIVAKYASFKSFVAMDLALHIATGLDWHGHRVTQGPVVYIAVEGVHGLLRRVEAWRLLNQLPDVGGIHFLPKAVILNDVRDHRDFLTTVASMPSPPVAVFVDTVARTIKGNESAAEDMNAYIDACTRLREATGATIALVHHTGWENDRSRGSSSLPGAADTELSLKRDDNQVTITATKQKDGAEGEIATLEAVAIGQSLAFRPVVPNRAELTRNERAALSVVQASEGMTSGDWHTNTGLAKGSFQNARTRLLTLAYVIHRKRQYFATEAGRQALSTMVNGGTTEVQPHRSTEVQTSSLPLGRDVVLDPRQNGRLEA